MHPVYSPALLSCVQAPCILFIDEFDGLGKQRSISSGGDDESVHTINQLLTGSRPFVTAHDVENGDTNSSWGTSLVID